MFIKKFIRERLEQGLTELDNKKIVAGVLIKCRKTGNIFFLLRNDKRPIWSMVTGTIEKGENVLGGLKREVYEELFLRESEVKIEFKFIRVEHLDKMLFHYYEGFVDNEFTPILDKENLNYVWTQPNHLPSPLYSGISEKVAQFSDKKTLEPISTLS